MNEYALLVILGILAVVSVAVLMRIFLAYRQYRISQGRLKLTQLATKIQDYMLDGTFKEGEHCHDLLYNLVVRAQSLDDYVKIDKLLRRFDAQIAKRTAYLLEEIEQHEHDVGAFTHEFVNTYFKVACWKNPVASIALKCRYVYMGLRGINKKPSVSRKEKLACWTVASGSMDNSPQLRATA